MLGWSINLFRVFGIQLAVHASFVLLLAYYGIEGWKEGGWLGAAMSVALIVLFFVCVVLHELGHSLTARRYGVQVPRILLMPIGGMAEFDRIPRKPSAELLITGAGPMVNFVIAAVLMPFFGGAFFHDVEFERFGIYDTGFQLLLANLVMGCFNMLPVFPMDGGRVFRALLSIKLPYLKATRVAVIVARVLAPILAIAAVYFLHWWLVAALFIFIFFAGDAEYKSVLRREQEAAYWAEWSKRVTELEAQPPTPGAEPPLIYHGKN